MKLCIETDEPFNAFRFAEFIYDMCESTGVSAETTAKMVLLQADSDRIERESYYDQIPTI